MSELSSMSSLNPRMTHRLIRSIDKLGLAQRVPNIDFDDGLSRATSGTKLNLNYIELNNAQSILVLTRNTPEEVYNLNKLQMNSTLNEDELIEEFDPASVSKVIHIIEKIGVIRPVRSSDEDTYEIVPNKECDEFLSDVLSISANIRRILGDEISIQRTLEDYFKDYDDEKMKKEAKKVEDDFTDEIYKEKRR